MKLTATDLDTAQEERELMWQRSGFAQIDTHCPPCNQVCNQGRTCPNSPPSRESWRLSDAVIFVIGIFTVCFVIGVAKGWIQ